MKLQSAFVAVVIAVAALFCMPVMAQAVTNAQPGTVVSISYAARTPAQQSYGYAYRAPQSNVRSIVGGALGGALGLLVARHSRLAYGAGASLAAIGYAVGERADQRAYERQQDGASSGRVGAQVIVKLSAGNVVAVFVPQQASQYFAGEKVWLIGNDELVPEN